MIRIILVWMVFGMIHSIMATDRTKQLITRQFALNMQHYRLLYNLVASGTLLLAVVVTHSSLSDERIVWHGGWIIIPVFAWLVAIGFFLCAAVGYDIGDFLGTRGQSNRGLSFSWSHRFVRHPWYFSLLLIIWFRNLSTGWLIANVCISVYLVVGVYCEETRLERNFGTRWNRYRKRVPALLPRPGKWLSARELHELQQIDSGD